MKRYLATWLLVSVLAAIELAGGTAADGARSSCKARTVASSGTSVLNLKYLISGLDMYIW